MPNPWPIKVGILISYDYRFVYECIDCIYANADKIVLAIDRDRLTWSGESFHLDPDFFASIKLRDAENKIAFYEDEFFIPEHTAMANDTRERNKLAAFMGSGGWHIQVDSDEYFSDFSGFVSFLRSLETGAGRDRLIVYANWFTLFKKTESGYFYIQDSTEPFPVATNDPSYDRARNSTSKKVTRIYTDYRVIHESWARSEDEILQKLTNWSHGADFPVDTYFRFWQSIDTSNYQTLFDFHPVRPATWHRMGYIEGDLSKVKEHVNAATPNHADLSRHITKVRRPASFLKRLWGTIRQLKAGESRGKHE